MKAILDSSVLISLYNLNLIHNLKLLYNKIYIPREVEKEFLNIKDLNESINRYNYFNKFCEENNSWFIRCNQYSDSIINLYLKELQKKKPEKSNKGEAEVLAQNDSLNQENDLLLDDKDACEIALKNNHPKHGTLYILSILDLKYKICNYKNSVEIIKKKLNFRASKKLSELVYNESVIKIKKGLI